MIMYVIVCIIYAYICICAYIDIHTSVSRLCSVPLVYVSVISPVQHGLNYYAFVRAKLLQSCLSLCPMDYSLPGSSVHGIFRQEYKSRLSCPPPGDLPDQGIKPELLMSPVQAVGFFTTSATWNAPGLLCLKRNGLFSIFVHF